MATLLWRSDGAPKGLSAEAHRALLAIVQVARLNHSALRIFEFLRSLQTMSVIRLQLLSYFDNKKSSGRSNLQNMCFDGITNNSHLQSY